MTTEALERAIATLCPEAGYSIAPHVLVKPGLPRRVDLEVFVWLPKRTLIYRAATNDEILERLKQDLHLEPSRLVVGDLREVG